MADDKDLRQYLLTTVVVILVSLAGCVGDNLLSRVEILEASDTKRQVEDATTKQELKDFRQSFEDFKDVVEKDIAKHRDHK